MIEKKERDFQNLIRHLDILPQEFVMIGNSIKSGVSPVLALGWNVNANFILPGLMKLLKPK
jgi:FMN phosphatase YigB (HAD superfamily)